MTPRFRSRLHVLVPRASLAALALISASAVQAQYKVIGADGKVTYTDREPNTSEGKVIPLGARGVTADATSSSLPYELQQVASKYPVTLYVAAGACEPCVSARQLLRQRGIPYTERLVVTAEDADALQKLTGAQDAPTLSIGSQILRGLSSDVWNSYLDAAGYPRTSSLPANYQYRPATPMVDQPAARNDARVTPPAAPATPQAPTPTSPGLIKF
jgi:glutaredoxin